MLTRRHLLAVFGASLVSTRGLLAQETTAPRLPGGAKLEFGPASPFSWEMLVERARRLRDAPFKQADVPVTDLLRRIGYEQQQRIYQPASGGLFAAPGRDSIVTAFHLNELHRRPVALNRLEAGEARPLLYRRGYFSYPATSAAAEMPDDAGFAGFRVHEPWNDDGQPGDWLAFLGASYFRSSGDLQQYGISARGLAVDTPPAKGKEEEFPAFTQFWIEEMRGGIMTIYALLEGESVTGAFRFAVTHRPAVTMEVTCRIYLRTGIDRLGVAPLTSMYWYSQERRWAGNWRPEIHDSDGLLIRTGDDFLWRPLNNPPTDTAVTSYPFADQSGFGLMQRDRDYDNYQDRAAFERRPNLWVEPKEGFGNGRIDLVELPTSAEFGDNIVAFFVPEKPAVAGSDFSFRYKLYWSGSEPPTALAKLIAHRLSKPVLNERESKARLERKIVADFAGAPLAVREPEDATIDLTPSRGRTFKPRLYRLPYRDDAWRLEFDLFSQGPDPIDLRLRLQDKGAALSEEVLLRVWPEQDLIK